MATIDRCKHGHPLTTKTTRWFVAKGKTWRKCRMCDAAAFRLKYQSNPEFRAAKQAANLRYLRTKVSPPNAV